MTTGIVVRENGTLTVRLPEDTVLPEGVVDIRVAGTGIMLTPSNKSYGERLVEILSDLDIELPDDLPLQNRRGL